MTCHLREFPSDKNACCELLLIAIAMHAHGSRPARAVPATHEQCFSRDLIAIFSHLCMHILHTIRPDASARALHGYVCIYAPYIRIRYRRRAPCNYVTVDKSSNMEYYA